MLNKFTALMSLVVLVMASSALQAEQVTVNFTASVNNPVNGTPFGLPISPADSVTGTFIYEATTPDTNGDVNTGNYPQTITDGFSVLVDGTHLFTSSDYVVEVNAVADEFHISVNTLNLNGNPVAFFAPGQIFTLDSAGDPFPNDSLPSLFPSFGSFGFAQGQFTDPDPTFDSFVFIIDSLTQEFVVVPEPVSLIFGLQAAVACLGLIVWHRRRK